MCEASGRRRGCEDRVPDASGPFGSGNRIGRTSGIEASRCRGEKVHWRATERRGNEPAVPKMSADSERTWGTPVLTLNYSPVQVVEVKGEVECEFARKPTT